MHARMTSDSQPLKVDRGAKNRELGVAGYKSKEASPWYASVSEITNRIYVRTCTLYCPWAFAEIMKNISCLFACQSRLFRGCNVCNYVFLSKIAFSIAENLSLPLICSISPFILPRRFFNVSWNWAINLHLWKTDCPLQLEIACSIHSVHYE